MGYWRLPPQDLIRIVANRLITTIGEVEIYRFHSKFEEHEPLNGKYYAERLLVDPPTMAVQTKWCVYLRKDGNWNRFDEVDTLFDSVDEIMNLIKNYGA